MTEARREHGEADGSQRSIAGGLRDPKAYPKLERLREEMFEKLASDAKGPIVNPGRRHSGRLVFGDATE